MKLLTMDCLPAGMELLGAVDEEHFEFIKRVIDDSDYYVLIYRAQVRHGSSLRQELHREEYDYAPFKRPRIARSCQSSNSTATPTTAAWFRRPGTNHCALRRSRHIGKRHFDSCPPQITCESSAILSPQPIRIFVTS